MILNETSRHFNTFSLRFTVLLSGLVESAKQYTEFFSEFSVTQQTVRKMMNQMQFNLDK